MEEAKAPVRRGAKSAKEAAPLPQEERIVKLPLTALHDFPNHPFKVRDDEAMLETAESIRQYGVLVPAIVRPRKDGGYEIVAGHRRKHGSELATPSLSQAQRMKKLSREGKLNDDSMLDIMMEQKKPEGYNVVLSADKLRKYFPRSYTPQRMEETILKLLDAWLRKRQREQSR